MKAKEIDAKKGLPVEELRNELNQLREKQFKLRFKHRVTPLPNPQLLRSLRRDIARIRTWIREKEVQGERT
ncbi:MAG: 50S ribosomal protein L29 [Elusimicrobiota bacterium]